MKWNRRCKWCGLELLFDDVEQTILHQVPPCKTFDRFIADHHPHGEPIAVCVQRPAKRPVN